MKVKKQVVLFLIVVFSIFVGVFSSYAGSISGQVRAWTKTDARLYNTMQRNDQGVFYKASPGSNQLVSLEGHRIYLLDSNGTVIAQTATGAVIANGQRNEFKFDNLADGNYTIVAALEKDNGDVYSVYPDAMNTSGVNYQPRNSYAFTISNGNHISNIGFIMVARPWRVEAKTDVGLFSVGTSEPLYREVVLAAGNSNVTGYDLNGNYGLNRHIAGGCIDPSLCIWRWCFRWGQSFSIYGENYGTCFIRR